MMCCRITGAQTLISRVLYAPLSRCEPYRSGISTCGLFKSYHFLNNERHSRTLHTNTSWTNIYQNYHHKGRFHLAKPYTFGLNKSLNDILSHRHQHAFFEMCHSSAKKGNHNYNFGPHKRKISLSAKEIVDASPPNIQLYLKLCRVDRPIGTWLVYLPAASSIAMAAAPGHLPDLQVLALFGLGAFLMRGAGCTVNDMWDKDIDRQVTRTRDRPLASGRLSNFQAFSFLGIQLTGALAILLTFNWYSIIIGASCMALVVTYPLMKRVTFWPQVFLGLTLNWGVLLGWSVLHGTCDWSVCLPLYAAGVLHTIIYDTIYAHRDKDDDIKINVKSSALYLGDRTKPWLGAFGTTMVGCLTLAGLTVGQTWPYYAGVAAVGGHLAHQIWTVNLEDADDCGDKFRSNRNLGFLLFAAIVTGNLLREKDEQKPDTSICNKDQATG